MLRGASIRTQLLSLILAVALPLAALVVWILYASAQDDERRARDQVSHLAQVTAADTARLLGQMHDILNGLAARPAVSALDASRCDPILKDFFGLAPRFANVATLAMDGRVICSGVTVAEPARGNPERFLNLMRGPDELTVGIAAPGVITGVWVVPIGRPLLDAQGAIAGAVVMPLNLEKLPVLPNLTGLPANTITGLVASDGTILASSLEPERFVGTKAGAGSVAAHVRRGTVDVMGVDGIARIEGFAPVPGTDWIAVASLPASAVHADLPARATTSALIALAVLFVALLGAAHWSRKIREPILALSDTVQEIAAGNSAARAPVGGSEEVAALANEFNRMIEALETTASERKRLAQMLEQTSDLIAVGALDGSLLYVNRAFRDVLGLAPDQSLEGVHVSQAYLPGRWEFARDVARPAAVKLGRWSGETVFRSHDGREISVLMVLTPMKDDRGEIVSFAAISRDISERKRADAERLRLLNSLDASLSEIYMFDPDTLQFTYANRGACRNLGYSMQALAAMTPVHLKPEFSDASFRALISPLVQGEHEIIVFETTHRRSDGTLYPVEVHLQLVTTDRERVFLAVILDITRRKQAAQMLRESEARMRSLLELSTDWYWEQDTEFRFKALSGTVVDRSGNSIMDVIGSRRWELPGRIPLSGNWDEHRAAVEAHRPFRDLEYVHTNANGDVQYVSVTGEPVFDAEHRFTGYRGTGLNITARRRAEQALLESRTSLEALSRRLLEVQEAERRALARELHDEVGGVLTALKLNLQALNRQDRGKGRDDLLADGLRMVDGAINSVRTLSLDLRPVILDDLGLIPALKWYCGRQAALYGVPIKLALDPIELKAAPQLESGCFRIVQESVTNALRHAKARRIDVALHRVDAGLTLEISDDGGGFDRASARARALAGDSSGLHGMDERVKLLGGKLSVDSAPGEGTRISVAFSMPEGGFG